MVALCDVLALGAHPDDVELGCGGTLARLSLSGLRVGVLDLTAGELGTRGDPALRRREAEAAAAALGVAWRECLGLPDGGLDATDGEQRRAVVGALRRASPRALLLPDPDDPHPDHAAAARLAVEAAFLAGVRRFAPGDEPVGRPRLLLAYAGPRALLRPALVIDVSGHQRAKRAALACHASQFDPAAGPATHLASGHYLAAVEGRDRAVGNQIGVALAEAFTSPWPLAADEVAWLLAATRAAEGRTE